MEVLKSIRIINGFVRIQSNTFKSLNFLRNLETIRANTFVWVLKKSTFKIAIFKKAFFFWYLSHDKYSIVIQGKSLRTLGLTKLRSIENGEVYIKAESLCLCNTIKWDSILNIKNSLTYSKSINQEINCGKLIWL